MTGPLHRQRRTFGAMLSDIQDKLKTEEAKRDAVLDAAYHPQYPDHGPAGNPR